MSEIDEKPAERSGRSSQGETLELYNSMAESIRNLTELLKMRGGVSSFVDFGEKKRLPS